MAKKSETLRQREKAQKDLLELKKMQQGLLDPTPKPSEEAVKPQTFAEKKENFFYHYKYFFFGGLALVCILAFLIVTTATRTKYDNTLTLFTYDYYSSEHIDILEETLAEYCPDADSNDEVNVAVVDCSFEKDTTTHQYELDQRGKVQAHIASGDTMLFLLDAETVENLEQTLDFALFPEEDRVNISSLFKEEFGELNERLSAQNMNIPKSDLYLCLRTIEGTLAENRQEEYNLAKQILETVKAKIEK